MKIIHILPSAGGAFYCENCMRDVAFIKALRDLGHDVVAVPLYLPIMQDDPDVSIDVPVFFGGVNVYLQQKFSMFRKTPRWVDKAMDSPWLLGMAARRAGATRADGLGAMTLSMLQGEDGRQAKELERLVTWLAEQEKPDVIHLSSALLLGLVGRFRDVLGVPVVCSLQDEHAWIDALDKPYDRKCWEAIRQRAEQVAVFIAVSRYYADVMVDRLGVSPDRLAVVPVGVEPDLYTQASLDMNPPTIGYLSRMSPSLGLGLLVDAFLKLRTDSRHAALRLRVTGGATGDDRAFLDAMRRKVAAAGATSAVDFIEAFHRDVRLPFLASLSVLSVPTGEPEAFGLFMLEAQAAGVPVVQPRLGASPELLEATGGGLLYEPNDARTLAATLDGLLSDPARLRELGRRGRHGVIEGFSLAKVACRLEGVYQGVC